MRLHFENNIFVVSRSPRGRPFAFKGAMSRPAHGCNNDRLFPEKYAVENHVSNTKLEKGDHYYIHSRHKDLFSH